MLVAENAKWDTQNRMEDTADEYLAFLNDKKPITIRQCIQALGKVALFKPGLNKKIASRLISFDLMSVKETMRKSIFMRANPRLLIPLENIVLLSETIS
ncbi:MAG TPA: hypothetical protein DCD97_04785 [Firmicutes bacterium]|jgi:hypothetical protein|nr:hypothetical protein [Bacillota bacterium]